MSSWVRGVACPGCLKVLYRLERSDEEAEWRHTGAPVEQDAIGLFVRCPNCKNRIGHRASDKTPGFGFEVFR